MSNVSKTCNVCKQHFPSSNQLFKHLAKYPLHQCEPNEISYTFRCRNCNYYKTGEPSIKHEHIVKEGATSYSSCNGVYVHSIDIRTLEKRYSISGSDESVTDLNKK